MRKVSFRSVLIALVVAFATFPAAILSSVAIRRIAQENQETSLNELKLKAESSGVRIAFELTRIADRLAAMAADSDVRRGVKSAFYLEKTDARLSELRKAHAVVAGAFLFDASGLLVSGIPEIYMAEAFVSQLKEIPSPLSEGRSFSELNAEGAAATIAEVSGVAGYDEKVSCVFVSVPVEGMVNVASGYLMAMIPVDALTSLIATLEGEAARVVLANSDDGLANESLLTAEVPISFPISRGGALTAVYGMERSKLLAPVRESAQRLTGYTVILIALVGILAAILAGRLLKPLTRLESQTENYASGNYDVERPNFAFREMEEFSKMLEEMAQKVGEREGLQKEVFRAELDLLRNQMNPHFLFNTLNAISTCMAIDPARATGMSERLASLYRMILAATKQSTVPLATEIEIVNAYLELESVRFGKRLSWSVECSVDSNRFAVPGLILQTLVENAIKHGVGKSMQGGRVEVGIAENDSQGCKVEVMNSGEPLRANANGGVGILNTRRRLDILYGNYHEFDIKTLSDGRTSVTFNVPIAKV